MTLSCLSQLDMQWSVDDDMWGTPDDSSLTLSFFRKERTYYFIACLGLLLVTTDLIYLLLGSFVSFCLTNLIVAIELIKNNEALTRNTSRCCDCNLGIGRCSSGMSQCMLWPWTMRSSRYVYMRS